MANNKERRKQMHKKIPVFSLFMVAVWLTLGASVSWAQGYPWKKNHASPYDFLFGNHIDTHQQTRVQQNGDLSGYLYIFFTGATSPEGLPVAEHCGDTTPANECVVGWILRGKPGNATFVFHGDDHPIWLVAGRSDIPQPGAYAHFHWLGDPLEAADLEERIYEGYFIELQAVKSFAFLHAEETIPVHQVGHRHAR
jgi:hypothetical protein